MPRIVDWTERTYSLYICINTLKQAIHTNSYVPYGGTAHVNYVTS